MKLALVIGSLQGGGAERVMATLANAWAQRSVAVTLITIADTSADQYPLDAAVRRISLGLRRSSTHCLLGLANNIRRVRALRATLRSLRPDAVLSFLTTNNVLSVVATRGLGIPVVVSERISISHRFPAVWRLLRALAYRRATALVVQTARGRAEFKTRMPTLPIHVIPNPLQMDFQEAPDPVACSVMDACRNRKMLMAVGRLAPQKGYDLLLRAFAVVSVSQPDACLVILGEGPERSRLEAIVRKLGLADRVLLPGFSRTPHALLQKADLFVLSSRYEGFPNALLEAMAGGLPCVSFDCPTGPAELLAHGASGLLVPAENAAALAAAMLQCMSDPLLRSQLGRAARSSAAAYSLDAVMAQWQVLFGACGMDTRAGATR